MWLIGPKTDAIYSILEIRLFTCVIISTAHEVDTPWHLVWDLLLYMGIQFYITRNHLTKCLKVIHIYNMIEFDDDLPHRFTSAKLFLVALLSEYQLTEPNVIKIITRLYTAAWVQPRWIQMLVSEQSSRGLADMYQVHCCSAVLVRWESGWTVQVLNQEQESSVKLLIFNCWVFFQVDLFAAWCPDF